MNKEIKYTGYTAIPSDYDSQDGTLSLSLNLINDNGTGLKTIPAPIRLKAMPQGISDVRYIHKTTEFTHYIILFQGRLAWIDSDPKASKITPIDDSPAADTITHINALGNTLLIFTPTAIHYCLWKDGAYQYLADHLPNIGISFGLVGHPRLFSISDDTHQKFKISFAEGRKDSEINATFSEANKNEITSQIMAKVNKFIANETIHKGRFCFPFFVRYALRLYDGSLVGHSAPILMNPATTTAPVVIWDRLTGKKDTYTQAEMDIMLIAATLDYRLDILGSTSDWTQLSDGRWSDIIKSIDIFISRPLYTFDQSGQCSSFSDSDNFESRFIGRLHSDGEINSIIPGGQPSPMADHILGPADLSSASFSDLYAEWRYSSIYALYFNPSRTYPATTLNLPEFSDDKQSENIRNTSTFYKLCSIDPATLYANRDRRTDIKIDDEYLPSLLTREVMTDDYLSHDRLIAENSYAYNNRINLSGVSRRLFDGFSPATAFSYLSPCEVVVSFNSSDHLATITRKGSATRQYIDVYVKENGKEYRLTSSQDLNMTIPFLRNLISDREEVTETYISGKSPVTYKGPIRYHWPIYLFYPNVNATRICLRSGSSSSDRAGFYISLQPHEFLNGAYAVLDYNHTRRDNSAEITIPEIPVPDPDPAKNNIVSVPNKVYTSEVNNPFYFPLLGINSVGTGQIKGLCTAARPLSQGQFGQFPLYAFTDEGVWAMEVSSEGTYTARQPITRDVCNNPDGITPIDSAVLFPTSRGIMLISGSQTQCISDPINTDHPFPIPDLPGIQTLHQMLHQFQPPTQDTPSPDNDDDCITIQPFSTFLARCGKIYDYVHQRIIVYNPLYSYAYVYSLNTRLWGMIQSDIRTSLNSYPQALAVNADGDIIDYSASDPTATEPRSGLLLTRPLKLDLPDILKTIDTIIQRGNFPKKSIRTILYGSRDLIHWHIIRSSSTADLRGFSGSPYKYFRIALLTLLRPDEILTGATIRFTPRQTNRLR